jgi:hypothetical protein
MTKKHLTRLTLVDLGAVAQLKQRVQKEEADFEADCKKPEEISWN